MNHQHKQIIRSLAIVVATIGLGTGATYASFTSNQVTVPDNLLTTGQANIKLCDVSSGNAWGNSTAPSSNLSGLIPDEERELFVSREVHVGNDNGSLVSALDQSRCSSYGDPANVSTTPMKLVPTVSFVAENCADSLPSHVRLRFEVGGVDTGYKTLNAWSTNTTQYGSALAPGGTAGLKVFAQLSSTASQQGSNCTFSIHMNGKQPTS